MVRYKDFFVSIDKIKLKGKLNRRFKAHFPHRNKINLWCDYGLPEWIECINSYENCFTPFKYRYCYTLRNKGDIEGSFTIFEWYNGDIADCKQKPENFMIEYNPNKSGAKIYKEFCNQFLFEIVDISSFDIAFDIENKSIDDIMIQSTCDIMTYGKLANKTLYIAPKEKGCGRVKVYNKAKERENVGQDLPDTLRIEVTIKNSSLARNTIYLHGKDLVDLEKICDRLNSVKIKARDKPSTDWKLYALTQLAPDELQKCFNMMASETRAKYKKQLYNKFYTSMEIEVIDLCKLLTELLKTWVERIRIK